MKGIDRRSGFVAGRARRTGLAAVSAMLMAFSLMATAAPAGAGGEQDKDIPGQCEPGYTKVVDDFRGGKSWTANADYSSVVLVGGPKDSALNKDPQGRNARFDDVKAGDMIARIEHDISHICAIPAPDTPSVVVVKDVRGDEGAKTTAFDILVGTRARNVTMPFEDGGSHTFLPLAGTVDFGIAEQPIDEDGWTTYISCVSDERKEPFGSRGPSLVIDEIGEGEDIVCTVINTYDKGDDDDGDDRSNDRPSRRPTATEIETPCFDGTAENEAGDCVKPAPPEVEVEVLGIQIEATTTTVDAVTTDTLPFTGDDSNRLVTAGLFVLLVGALVLGGSFFELSLIRVGRHEPPSRSFRRWVNS